MTEPQRALLSKQVDRIRLEILEDEEALLLITTKEASNLIDYLIRVLRTKDVTRSMESGIIGPEGERYDLFDDTRDFRGYTNAQFYEEFEKLLVMAKRYDMSVRGQKEPNSYRIRFAVPHHVDHYGRPYYEDVTIFENETGEIVKYKKWYHLGVVLLQACKNVRKEREIYAKLRKMRKGTNEYHRFKREADAMLAGMKVVVN